MLITLSDATPADDRYRYRRAPGRTTAERVIPAENRGKFDWRTQTTTPSTETVLRTTIPEEPEVAHLNYLEALGAAWGRHRGIVFTPDILWFGLLTELAKGVVENPDPHRSLFTRSPDNIAITVPVGATDDVLPLNAILAELGNLVPVPVDLFVPRFSTTTDMARFAHLAAFAEACSPYYSYMTMACQIPFVRIEGEQADWDWANDRAVKLHDEFARIGSPLTPWIAEQMVGLTSKVADALRKPEEGAEFFRQMFFAKSCGSGGEISVDGWWSRLHRVQPGEPRKPENFPTQVARVPWENAETGRRFTLNAGIMSSVIDPEDGALVPDFHYVQTEIGNGAGST